MVSPSRSRTRALTPSPSSSRSASLRKVHRGRKREPYSWRIPACSATMKVERYSLERNVYHVLVEMTNNGARRPLTSVIKLDWSSEYAGSRRFKVASKWPTCPCVGFLAEGLSKWKNYHIWQEITIIKPKGFHGEGYLFPTTLTSFATISLPSKYIQQVLLLEIVTEM